MTAELRDGETRSSAARGAWPVGRQPPDQVRGDRPAARRAQRHGEDRQAPVGRAALGRQHQQQVPQARRPLVPDELGEQVGQGRVTSTRPRLLHGPAAVQLDALVATSGLSLRVPGAADWAARPPKVPRSASASSIWFLRLEKCRHGSAGIPSNPLPRSQLGPAQVQPAGWPRRGGQPGTRRRGDAAAVGGFDDVGDHRVVFSCRSPSREVRWSAASTPPPTSTSPGQLGVPDRRLCQPDAHGRRARATARGAPRPRAPCARAAVDSAS